MEKLIQQLLIESYVFHIEKETLSLQLKSHPDASSVKAISDTLDYFNIKNIVANVPKDALLQLPTCFLAIIKKGEHSELVLIKVRKNKIVSINANQEVSKMSVESFKTLWVGTIIAIEKEVSRKKSIVLSLNRGKILSILLIAFLILLQVMDFNPILMTYQILLLVGLYISMLIIREDIGIHNVTVAKLCNAISVNSSCTEVINSGKSKTFAKINLSDATITFFMSLLLVVTLVSFNDTLLLFVASLSIIAVLFSIYYQAFSIKKWCLLCLGISGVLTAQFVLLALNFSFTEIPLLDLIKSVVIIIGVIASWNYIKPILINSIKLETTKTDFLKFKRNKNVFNFLLSQKKVTEKATIPQEYQVVFGNPEAKLVIKAVFNPLCGYCVEPFKMYDTILNRYAEDVQVQFIFNVSDNPENVDAQISSRIIETYFEGDTSDSFNMLREWFANRDIRKWKQKFDIGTLKSGKKFKNAIAYHSQWCSENEVYYTPVTLIQNYFFPTDYNIEDLLLFMDDLVLNSKSQPVLIQNEN